jgi:hypothetical protein
LRPLKDAHEMIKLNFELKFFQKELKEVYVLDVGDVRLYTNVELERWVYSLHREVVVRHLRIGALGLEDNREERHHLPVVVDLHPAEGGLVNPFSLLLANHRHPLVEHERQHLNLVVD